MLSRKLKNPKRRKKEKNSQLSCITCRIGWQWRGGGHYLKNKHIKSKLSKIS